MHLTETGQPYRAGELQGCPRRVRLAIRDEAADARSAKTYAEVLMKKTCLFVLIVLSSPGVWAGQTTTKDQTYTNPIIDRMGLADPSVIRYEGKYYLYPTGDFEGVRSVRLR